MPASTSNVAPVTWREAYPYWPFFETDAADAFWAARIMARIDRSHVEAVVNAAHLSSPDSTKYFIEALMARHERVLRAFFEADVRWLSHYGFRTLDLPTLAGGLSA